MSNMLEKLAANRTPILLAEMGAYLHLIGRFSKEFIDAQAEDATPAEKSFEYKNVCVDPNFFENTRLDSLLKDACWETLINDFKNVSNLGELSTSKIKSFCDFIKKHMRNDDPKGLGKILADSHGIVSGIDKALAGRGELGKQKKSVTFRSTAFGYEYKMEFPKDAKKHKKDFFQKIEKILERIKNNQDVLLADYRNFMLVMKKYYSMTIGETRRPINEISLHDYAHAIASLMKASLAKIIIDGWQDPITRDFNKLFRWRILRINVDVIGLLGKGLKIGDIVGYRSEIDALYDEIKKILEFEYPMGNEVYRDSTGIYFTCPDVNDIEKLKLEVIDKLKSLDTLDFSLQIENSEENSRSMVILASEREKATRKISYPHHSNADRLERDFKQSQNEGGNDICLVCRIRLKLESEDRCKKCKERYHKRAKDWIENPNDETIWLDEVADKNGRVALIVGQFNLKEWISGRLVSTFVSRTFDEWKKSLSRKNANFLEKNMKINTLDDLESFFSKLFSDNVVFKEKEIEILDKLVNIEDDEVVVRKQDPNYPDRVKKKFHPDKFDIDKHIWNPISERDATEEAPKLNDASKKATHLVKLLFRKHPSFARIHRIWNTTQEFITETVFEEILKKYDWNSEVRRQRIVFKITPNPMVPKGAACNIDIDGMRISPVCVDKQNGIFISTINLEILNKYGKTGDEISKKLNGKIIKIKRDADSTWKSRKNGSAFKISNARLAGNKFQNYLPFVRIHNFPDLFMVIVPAREALDISEKIVNEYEIQFSKVRDRLPFHLGMIAFDKKTPLYVVMDAGKRLLETFTKTTRTEPAKIISIEDINNHQFGKARKLRMETKSYSSIPLEWTISYSTKDPSQEDLWHPYIRFNGNNRPDRKLCFDYTGNGDYVVHVKELIENDEIMIETSYFKLFYLEDAADRFRIDEDLRPLDHVKYLKELWNEIEDRLRSKIWSVSQVHSFLEEIRKRRQNYTEEGFKTFVNAALVNILGIKQSTNKKMFKLFFRAAIDQTFDLCLFWNFQVRKITLKR